jgi:hypothetical protein
MKRHKNLLMKKKENSELIRHIIIVRTKLFSIFRLLIPAIMCSRFTDGLKLKLKCAGTTFFSGLLLLFYFGANLKI